MRRTVVVGAVVGLLVFGGTVVPANAAVPEVSSQNAVAVTDAPDFDPTVPDPGPNDLTWSQLSAMNLTGDYSSASIAPDPRGRSVAVAAAGSCHLDTGPVYKRSSGNGLPSGAVGAKPKTTCTVAMVNIKHSSTMYKTVWWGLQQVGGPFTGGNYGVSSYEQKNILVPCVDLRDTTFRVIVSSSGTFPNGSTTGASAYEEATWPCGTNP